MPSRAVVGIVASLIVPVAVAARALEPAGSSGCTISGTNGNDVLRGTPSRDVICGRNGDDALAGATIGSTGDPTPTISVGGRGTDLVTGGAPTTTSRAAPAGDAIRGDSGSDIVQGGRGRDFCVPMTASAATTSRTADRARTCSTPTPGTRS